MRNRNGSLGGEASDDQEESMACRGATNSGELYPFAVGCAWNLLGRPDLPFTIVGCAGGRGGLHRLCVLSSTACLSPAGGRGLAPGHR